MDARVAGEILAFGDWRFDRQARLLYRLDGTESWTQVPIGSRAQAILMLLLEQPGTLVSKDTIMAAVWPNTAVEANNLNAQVAALRRVLDADRTGSSCIQTVSGRGYRFAVPVRLQEEVPGPSQAPPIDHDAIGHIRHAEVSGDPIVPALDTPVTAHVLLVSGPLTSRKRGAVRSALLAGLCLIVATSLYFGSFHSLWFASPAERPRLSLVVLPFENLSGDPKDDYLADGITDDLTSDLSHIRDTFVIARESAYTYRRKPTDVRKIGEELGVRYVLEGSVRRMDATLRVNVQLTSGETGAHLWSDRFDEPIVDLAAGQEEIVTRVRSELGISMVEIERARSLRERPTNPDAFDLILQAWALQNLPPNPQRTREALSLYERAHSVDPSSVVAMANIAYYLLDPTTTGLGTNFEDVQRAERLLKQARTIEPASSLVLAYTVLSLSRMGRCQEVIESAQQAIRADPNQWTGTYNELGKCKTWTGHAEEEIPLQAEADRRNPHGAFKNRRYNRMAFASLMLGRDQDAIIFYRRSLAVDPGEGGNQRVLRELAAAYARTGQMEEARRRLAEADQLWPYDTVRSWSPALLNSPVYVEQFRHFLDALRLAGERDHADEDEDFGVPADDVLHNERAGPTPTSAPGTQTIRTTDLRRLLADARPIVVDTMLNSWGQTIPGAVGLRLVGLGGSVTDSAQDHLRSKMVALTAGDRSLPIVAVGFNSESFDGRNLALRLVALGYTNVYWYRGGREAWEVNALPETELEVQEW